MATTQNAGSSPTQLNRIGPFCVALSGRYGAGLASADQLAWTGLSGRAISGDYLAGHDGRDVAVGGLVQATPAGGQVVCHRVHAPSKAQESGKVCSLALPNGEVTHRLIVKAYHVLASRDTVIAGLDRLGWHIQRTPAVAVVLPCSWVQEVIRDRGCGFTESNLRKVNDHVTHSAPEQRDCAAGSSLSRGNAALASSGIAGLRADGILCLSQYSPVIHCSLNSASRVCEARGKLYSTRGPLEIPTINTRSRRCGTP